MRLEKKEQEVLEQRKGLTIKTIIQFVWLLISFAIAYFVLEFLEADGRFTYPQLRRLLTLPGEVPDWAIQFGLMLIFVVLMQFVLFLAFVWTSPEGRRRPGDASLHSRRKDPFGDSLHDD